MQIQPCYYFRPIHTPITLSHFFNIQLRNPYPDELHIFEQNLQTLSSRLSDKERRRILYTLFPLGNFKPEGTLAEQFVRELSKIWVIATTDQDLPFEQGLVDYGFLCGFISDNRYHRNPSGFICDIKDLSPRALLRALKTELPKAAKQILDPSINGEDLQILISQASYWDGMFSTNQQHCINIARSLRLAQQTTDQLQKLLQYCITAEILLVHNPSKGDSKMPMNRQFASKLALIRHFMIKLKNQQYLETPTELQKLFTQLYDIRSNIIHGREHPSLGARQIAQYLNILYPTIRLALELQTTDPLFIDFIKKI